MPVCHSWGQKVPTQASWRKSIYVRKNGVGTGHSLNLGIFPSLPKVRVAERGLTDRQPGKLTESREKSD